MFVDLINLSKFYMALLLLNAAVLPLTVKMFGNFADKGTMFGKSLGMYICGYTMWLFSSCHIFKFTMASSLIISGLIALSMYGYVYWRFKSGDNSFFISIRDSWRNIFTGEIIFLISFVFFAWLFAHRVPDFGTERMMDYGFMVSLFKTDYMPPLDIWAATCDTNYYYFGQYIFTFMAKILGISVGYAYSFGMAMIASWALVAVYRLVYDVCNSRVGAFISAGFVTLGGNFHYIIFKYLVPIFWEILQIDGEKPSYWFANTTRYIGYTPEVVEDKTIHEIPAYSFIVGDLHAHVVDILVVVCILAVLWAWLSKKEELKNEVFWKKLFCREFIVIGFLIAICSMSNYWDFPIYYVVSGSVILFGFLRKYGIKSKAWIYVACAGVMIMVENLLLSLPFNLKFEKMIQGIETATTHSRIYQLLILWAYPVLMIIIYIAFVVKKKISSERSLYTILLGLCAIGLVLIPEFIYVKDIYVVGFPRANTMFKLTYEAHIIFGICIGCVISELLRYSRKTEDSFEKYIYRRRAIVGGICAILLIGYFPMAAKMWYDDNGGFNYISMDAAYNIVGNNSTELDAINSLIGLAEYAGERQPVVLVADGDSYSDDCSISVITGFPTVLGWHTHEWLWRNSKDFITEREADVTEIYTGTDIERTAQLLKEYDVTYVYIGLKEYEKYEEISTDVLEYLGDIVYCQTCETGQLIEIIKIK